MKAKAPHDGVINRLELITECETDIRALDALTMLATQDTLHKLPQLIDAYKAMRTRELGIEAKESTGIQVVWDGKLRVLQRELLATLRIFMRGVL